MTSGVAGLDSVYLDIPFGAASILIYDTNSHINLANTLCVLRA